jgi:hypothetical protein
MFGFCSNLNAAARFASASSFGEIAQRIIQSVVQRNEAVDSEQRVRPTRGRAVGNNPESG